MMSMSGTRLRHELDRIPLWRGDDVAVRQLAEDFAKYLYLPRLRDPEVLAGAIRDGVALLTWEKDTFAFADSRDDVAGRYRGLRGKRAAAGFGVEPRRLLVKADIAARQMEIDAATANGGTATADSRVDDSRTSTAPPGTESPVSSQLAALPKRFYGTKTPNSLRVGLDAGKVADEVVAHLVGTMGARVTVRLEIEAILPGGAGPELVRVVTENARTLKFESLGFETE